MATLFYEPRRAPGCRSKAPCCGWAARRSPAPTPRASSAAKGESLADTVRVVSNYADVLVIRHPRDGAVKLAAQYASVPIINGGDGAHEHPTQTLCDLFTLRRENKTLKNLNVAVSGDLKGQPDDPLVCVRAGPLRRQHPDDARQRHGIAGTCRLAAAPRISCGASAFPGQDAADRCHLRPRRRSRISCRCMRPTTALPS